MDENDRRQPSDLRRWLAVAIAVVVVTAGIALLVFAVLRDDPADTQTGTETAPTLPPTSTTTTIGPAGGLSFGLALPAGWAEIPGALYLDLGDLPTARTSATVATYEFTAEPSRICDVPVAALEALPPTGAFVSVVDALPPVADVDPKPAPETFLPGATELDLASDLCLDRAADYRFAETGFSENARGVRVFVALGPEADSATEAQVLEIVGQLVVEARASTTT